MTPRRTIWLACLLLLAAASAEAAATPPAADLREFIASEAAALDGGSEGPAELRLRFVRSLGIEDMLGRRGTLAVSISTESAHDGYIERRLSARGPARALSALLLVPKDLKGPFPAVLGLGDPQGGAVDMRDRYFGRELARRGYVVLLPEPDKADPAREFDDAFNLLLLGRSLTGLRVLEAVTWLDFLESDPAVDPARLGVLGHGAGSLAATFVAAIDERPRALAADLSPRGGVYFDFAPELLVPSFYRLAASGALDRALAGRARLNAPFRFPDRAAVLAWFDDRLKKPGAADHAARPLLDDWLDQVFAAHKTLPPGAAVEPTPPLSKAPEDEVRADESALREEPRNPRKLESIGMKYLERGDSANARRFFESAAESSRNDQQRAKLYRLLSKVQEDVGLLEDALRTLLDAQRLEPADIGSYVPLGRLYLRLGRYSEAKEGFIRALTLRPKQAHLGLAAVDRQHGRWEEAQHHYREALRYGPNAELWGEVAWLDMLQGRWKAASQAYLTALELDPRLLTARMGLSLCWERLGRRERALQEASEVRRLGGAAFADEQRLNQGLYKALEGLSSGTP